MWFYLEIKAERWAFGPGGGWPWAATLGLGQPRHKPWALFLNYYREVVQTDH